MNEFSDRPKSLVAHVHAYSMLSLLPLLSWCGRSALDPKAAKPWSGTSLVL